MQETRPKVVAVANQKGGVGKTTTAINLAACLAEFQRTVLVVDMDPQANATSGLGLEEQSGSSLYRALIGEGSIHGLVRETLVDRVHIIPSELDLAGAEVEIAQSDSYLHRCREALIPAVEDGRYSYIIIDCPPSLGILTMNALAAADTALLPIQSEYYALEGLSVISRLIRKLNSNGTNPGLSVEGILLTMFDKRTNLSSQVVEEVRRHFSDEVYNTVIPRNVRLSEAPSYGMPIIMYDRSSAGAMAYMAMTEEFLKRNDDSTDQS